MGTKRGAIAAPKRAALASFFSLKPASAERRTSTASKTATRTTRRKEAISAKEHKSTLVSDGYPNQQQSMESITEQQ